MTISTELREQVRQRAGFACECCSVTETDTAGQLTVDHFRPQSRGGTDEPDNLLYCCHRCNEYKADFWPQGLSDGPQWNPRQETIDAHFVELVDGRLYAITTTGTFTLQRLRLNRDPLVAYRLRRLQNVEERRLLTQLQDILALLEPLQAQQTVLLQSQQSLLQEQQRMLRLLLHKQDAGSR